MGLPPSGAGTRRWRRPARCGERAQREHDREDPGAAASITAARLGARDPSRHTSPLNRPARAVPRCTGPRAEVPQPDAEAQRFGKLGACRQ